MKTTNVFDRNLDAYLAKKELIPNQGGTSSSKTYSLLQLLLIISIKRKRLISIVSESMPHLKRGALRDFNSILEENNLMDAVEINKTDNIYRIGKGAIEFFSADQPSKVRGPRRDILFVNECNNIPHEAFHQMMVRTRECVFTDYNPVSEFWMHEEGYLDLDTTQYIHSTYKDNQYLDEKIIRDIERRRGTEWFRVYGDGEVGMREGLVYNNWEIIDDVPQDARALNIGLDWGFTSPTAATQIYKYNKDLVLDELIYETHLTNNQIAEKLGKTRLEIVADSAEPKSITDLRNHGLIVTRSIKGAGSINSTIRKVQEYRLLVTKRSVNIIKELRNYTWKTDRISGKPLNIPIDDFDHALNGIGYAVVKLSGNRFGAM